ncbi:MAG: ABC transporter ATP-binding protein [Actinomycetaceae bacterium]|nr:ABC transporter ATP-binding protein [Actinomycetaceae bacterium]
MKLPVASNRQSLRSTWRIIRQFRGLITVVVIFQLLAALSAIAMPWIVGHLIDLINAGTSKDTVVSYLIVVGILVIAQTGFGYVGEYTSRIFGEGVYAKLREDLVDTVAHLPLSAVESAGTGDLLGRTTHDVSRVEYMVRQGLSRILVLALTIIGTLVAAFFVSPLLSIVLVFPILANPVVIVWYLRRATPGYRAASAEWANISGIASETVEHASTVDALSLAKVRNNYFDTTAQNLWKLERYTTWLRFILLGTLIFIDLLPVILVVLFGAWGIAHGFVTLGAVTTVALYAMQLRGPLGEFGFWVDILQVTSVSLARIFGVSNVPADREPTGQTPDDNTIRAHGVTYAYREGRDVLHDVDLELHAGETLAIVGPSGAGKSTFGRMLAGIHPPNSGSVEAGGVPLVELTEDTLHHNVVLVTQEHHVFVGTVADNLRLVKPDVSIEQMRGALEAVEALEWVDSLDDGLDTVVGSGALELSPAQAQQLALARIVLMDPHTLVLDEATSLMDPTAARSLERALGRVLAGRTVVAIAHRLYTAHDADRIAVMVDGRIVELGTHDELVARGGEYAELWKVWSHE